MLAWWFVHDPPLLVDGEEQPVPEMAIAVDASFRGQGIGTALIEALASRRGLVTVGSHSTCNYETRLRGSTPARAS